jgi:hypothetical protein
MLSALCFVLNGIYALPIPASKTGSKFTTKRRSSTSSVKSSNQGNNNGNNANNAKSAIVKTATTRGLSSNVGNSYGTAALSKIAAIKLPTAIGASIGSKLANTQSIATSNVANGIGNIIGSNINNGQGQITATQIGNNIINDNSKNNNVDKSTNIINNGIINIGSGKGGQGYHRGNQREHGHWNGNSDGYEGYGGGRGGGNAPNINENVVNVQYPYPQRLSRSSDDPILNLSEPKNSVQKPIVGDQILIEPKDNLIPQNLGSLKSGSDPSLNLGEPNDIVQMPMVGEQILIAPKNSLPIVTERRSPDLISLIKKGVWWSDGVFRG